MHAAGQGRGMSMLKRFVVFFGLGLGLMFGVRLALAQTPAPAVTDDEVNRVAKQMFCPVCENVPLDVCPTEACRQWRQTIREKLQAGWSDQQIKDYFVEQYGERVLAQPSTRGIVNVLLWVLPPVGVLVGAVILWRVLRQMAPKPAAAAPPASGGPAAGQDDYLARLEAELKERK